MRFVIASRADHETPGHDPVIYVQRAGRAEPDYNRRRPFSVTEYHWTPELARALRFAKRETAEKHRTRLDRYGTSQLTIEEVDT